MDRYEARLNLYGSTQRERNLNRLKQTIAKDLPQSLSCKTVQINNHDRQLNFTETKTGYDIQSLPNEIFSVGDYVIYKTLTYLITKVNGDDEVYTKGSMEQCNYTLKFQHPDTGVILSYPCIEESSNMAVGIDESDIINTLNGIKRIKLPFDDNTKLITVDDRFFITKGGTTTYKVTNVNDTEFNYGDKGLIVLTLKADSAYNPLTDKNGVCNYFEPTVEPETPVEGYSYATITCSGDLILGNSNYITLSPTFYNADGTVNEVIPAIWNYTYPLGNKSAFTIIPDGNIVKIKVADEMYELIGKRLVCNVSDGNGGFVGMVELEITAGW